MDKKKFKILMIVDIVLIIGLFALMMVLKGQYNDQAQKTVKEQVDAYLELSNGAVQEQWKAVDQYGMAWRLVYATLTSAKTAGLFTDVTRITQFPAPTAVILPSPSTVATFVSVDSHFSDLSFASSGVILTSGMTGSSPTLSATS